MVRVLLLGLGSSTFDLHHHHRIAAAAAAEENQDSREGGEGERDLDFVVIGDVGDL